jgi:hypothetical protein
MKNKSLNQLGGICAILVGISYVVVGITHLLIPAEQKTGADPAVFLTSFAQSPTMAILEWWALALGAVLALAVVPAISEKVRSANEGWVRWTGTLATVGFAFTALQYFRYLAIYPTRAATYMAADTATKAAMAANQPIVSLDPQGWLTYGAVGLWFLVVNLLALRNNLWPRLLAYMGIIAAILYWFVVAGFVLQTEILIAIAAAGAVIIGPIWYIWAGLMLRRASP